MKFWNIVKGNPEEKVLIMRDETLLKLSLLTSIIGIILFFIFAQAMETEEFEIESIEKLPVGKNIELFANISSFYVSNGNYFLKISDKTGNITAVMFKQTANKIDISKIKKGQKIRLIGKVSDYKGNLEIIASKIEFFY